MVTSIKFSNDYRYFISGDMDGVLHHYVRNTDDNSNEIESSSIIQSGTNRIGLIEQSGNKAFPYTLKVI